LEPEDLGVSERLDRFRAEIGMGEFVAPDGTTAARADGGGLAVGRAVFDHVAQIERGRRRVAGLVASQLKGASRGDDPIYLTGADGSKAIERAWLLLDSEIKTWCSQRLSPYEWIWMIRRLPMAHIWGLGARLSGKLHLASMALSTATRPSAVRGDGFVEVGKVHGKALAYLVGIVDALLDFEMCYRVVGKGGTATLRVREGRLHPIEDEQLRLRLQEYDDRVRAHPAWGGLGVHSPQLAGVREEGQEAEGPFVMVAARAMPRWVDGPKGAMGFERFTSTNLDLTEVFDLLANARALPLGVPTTELGALLSLLGAYLPLEGAGRLKTANVRMVGYSVHLGDVQVTEAESVVGEALRKGIEILRSRAPHWAPESVESAWRTLRAIQGGLFPRRAGPVVISLGQQGFIVDWHAACIRLLERSRYPRVDGPAANVRSGTFEAQVREAIGRTPCRPMPWLEKLQGVHLRPTAGEDAFGEIDAAASLPGGAIHLLVSCKSYLFSEEYQRGDYKVCRNISLNLEADILAALRLAERLQSHREGANYRIPNDAVLLPIVITPRHMYCAADVSRHRWGDLNDGPPVCGGLQELLDYLDGLEPTAE
jgi:hypothetical protein